MATDKYLAEGVATRTVSVNKDSDEDVLNRPLQIMHRQIF
jgi:hypothetical protein